MVLEGSCQWNGKRVDQLAKHTSLRLREEQDCTYSTRSDLLENIFEVLTKLK